MSIEKRKWVVPLVILAIAIVVTVILMKAGPQVETAPPETRVPLVRVVEVSSADLRLNVSSQGTIEARRHSEIAAQVAGRIVSVSPDFAAGGSFREGEILLRLDPRDYEVGVAQAQAALAQARTRLAREQAEAAVAREEWEELGSGPASPLVLRQPQVAEATAAVEAAEASLMQAGLNLTRTTIRAPFDGRILAKRADLGQFVAPGVPIATMYATDYAEVTLPVTSGELAFVDLSRIGSAQPPRVVLTAEFAGAQRRWEGVLVRTGAAIDSSSRMLELVARVDEPFRASGSFTPLQLGMFVQAEIEGEVVRDVFVIPRAALMRESKVLVVDSDDRVRFRTVGVIRTTEREAVISSGLEDGDRVVLSALEAPVEGMRVEVAGPAVNGAVRDGADLR